MSIGSIFGDLVTIAKSDQATLLPLLGKAALTLAENPTQVGAITAGVTLLEGVVQNFGPQVAQELSSFLMSEFNSVVANALTKAAPPTPQATKAV